MIIDQLIVPILMLAVPIIYMVWYNIKIKSISFNRSNPNTLAVVIVTLLIAAIGYFFVTHIVNEEKEYRNELQHFCTGLYISSFFALLYSITAEKNNIAAHNNIMQKLDSKEGFDMYKGTNAKDPDKDLFKKLSQEILDDKYLIYEGDTAVTASMCLFVVHSSLETLLKNNPNVADNVVEAKLILEQFAPIDFKGQDKIQINKRVIKKDDYERSVIDLFTTIYILREILEQKRFKITIYKKKRQSPHYHYVNLTKSSLFFSASTKNEGNYPPTFNFMKGKGLFFQHFVTAMDARIDNWEDDYKYVIHDSSLFDLFKEFKFELLAQNGYFDNQFPSDKQQSDTEAIKKYFNDKFKKRKKNYKNCIINFNSHGVS